MNSIQRNNRLPFRCGRCAGAYMGPNIFFSAHAGPSVLRDQLEAMARDVSGVKHSQTIRLVADALREALEQLSLIQEKRAREDRIVYGHGKTKRKDGNDALR